MPQTHKLALLDDYQKVAMRMADWDRLKKRGVEITVFHDAFKSVEDAVQKLARGMFITALPATKDQPIIHSEKFVLVDGQGQIRGYYDNSDPQEMKQLPIDAARIAGG